MDPQLVLAALATLLLGAVLTATALLCRAGRSPAARFWVRTAPLSERPGFPYGEVAMLVVLPLFAQLGVVVGLLLGIAAVDALRGPFLDALLAVVVIGQVALWVALLATVSYRAVMPLWVYPSWLRPERRRERDLLRSGRGRGAA